MDFSSSYAKVVLSCCNWGFFPKTDFRTYSAGRKRLVVSENSVFRKILLQEGTYLDTYTFCITICLSAPNFVSRKESGSSE